MSTRAKKPSTSHESSKVVADLTSDATAVAKWAETQKPPNGYPGYKRLTDLERSLILQLHDSGLTQAAIAQRVDRTQDTVFNVIHAFTDTIVNAKRYLRAQAMPMAENIVKNGLPRDHVATLKGIGVLEETAQQGFTVNIGITDAHVQVNIVQPAAKDESS